MSTRGGGEGRRASKRVCRPRGSGLRSSVVRGAEPQETFSGGLKTCFQRKQKSFFFFFLSLSVSLSVCLSLSLAETSSAFPGALGLLLEHPLTPSPWDHSTQRGPPKGPRERLSGVAFSSPSPALFPGVGNAAGDEALSVMPATNGGVFRPVNSGN